MVCDARNKFNIDNGLLFLLLASITIFLFSACVSQATSKRRADSDTAKPTVAAPTETIKPSPTATPLRNADDSSTKDENGRRERIEFGKGKTGATIRGATPFATVTDRYTIAARTGQEMTVQISAKDETVDFSLTDPSYKDAEPSKGGVLKDIVLLYGEEGKRSWTGKLPRDGDYIIEVASRYGGSKYTLKVTVR